ncbi:hypothetical protein ACRRTK_011997 [Alexandromys fortis]
MILCVNCTLLKPGMQSDLLDSISSDRKAAKLLMSGLCWYFCYFNILPGSKAF